MDQETDNQVHFLVIPDDQVDCSRREDKGQALPGEEWERSLDAWILIVEFHNVVVKRDHVFSVDPESGGVTTNNHTLDVAN